MSNSFHTLDRMEGVSTVFGGLPFNEVAARDALEAIQHELRIYETETRELYTFVGRVRRFLQTKSAPADWDVMVAEELDSTRNSVGWSRPSTNFSPLSMPGILGRWS
jgi:hypothetical protein